MDPITLAAIAAPVIGGLFGSSSASRAAATQAAAAREQAAAQLQASREAMALQREMFGQGLAVQAPYLRSSQTAMAALLGGLGLGDIYNQPQQQVIGGPAPMNTYGASPEQMRAAAGEFSGRFRQRFAPSDIYEDPSYKFRVEQGLRALQARGAATGMLQTGQGLRDITDYGQRLAAEEYQAGFNRFQTEQQREYERLAALAGIGPGVATNVQQAGTQLGGQLGSTLTGGQTAASNLLTSGAAAQAGGIIGGANAISQGLGGGAQNWMTLQALQRPVFGYSPYQYGPYAGMGSAVDPMTGRIAYNMNP